MATSASVRQCERQTFNVYNEKSAQFQDKRLPELRAFALEYVKQIIVKANELSQEQRYDVIEQEQQQQRRSNGQLEAHKTTEIASQIIKVPAERVGQVAEQINERFQLNASYKPTQKTPPRPPPAQATRKPKQTTVDEISCENYLEESRSTARSRGEDAGKWSVENNSSSTGKRSGLHNRLNWHLFISCFSTCLPQTLVDSMPSSTTGKAAGNAGGQGTAV